MPNTPLPPVEQDGRFVDSATGLIVPRTYPQHLAAAEVVTALDSSITGRGFSQGLELKRDSETLAVRWPLKGSGLDDIVNQAIVNGTVANVGVSPVVAPQISGMVRRQQNQAATASIDLTGRTYSVKQARDALSRFNDSPLGVTQALERIVYNLCTYNRGAPIATVPIPYAVDQWAQYGLRLVEIQAGSRKAKRRRAVESDWFYLEVDWAKHGQPVPFLPSVYDLEPTGIQNWPYWYRVKLDDRYVWVLLHHTHIIEFTPGTTSKPGIGTSPVWMCLGYLAEQILITEERSEKMLYSMTDGIILLGGVEGLSGDQIKDNIVRARMESINRGFVAAKGSTILVSPNANAVNAVSVSFRQPSGIEFEQWRQYIEDIIAFSFGETLSALVVRGGVGYGAQSDTAADNSAESGVGAILNTVALALGAMYPRVQVSVSRPNDRAQRLNIQTLGTFAQSATALLDRGVLSPEEARAIINRDILAIPETGIDTIVATANADDTTDAVDEDAGAEPAADTERRKRTRPLAASVSTRQFETLHDDGEVTITDDDVERALEKARTRIDPDLYALLTATPVEE